MESGFSLAEREEVEDNKNEKSAGTMMKKVSYMAAPMVAVYLSQYLLQVISMIMAGHLDELSLSSVAIATSLTNVTGFSLLVRRYLSLCFCIYLPLSSNLTSISRLGFQVRQRHCVVKLLEQSNTERLVHTLTAQ